MANLVVNFRINGYEEVGICDSRICYNEEPAGDQSITEKHSVIIVLSEKAEGGLREYYYTMVNLLKNHHELYLIHVDGKSDMFRALATLMVMYRNYNVYEVASEGVISSAYVRSMIQRKPTYSEVGTYIGGDLTAYNDISILMIGIENLIQEGNVGGMATFFESHMPSIDKLTASLDYMKTVCDLYNTDELGDKINKLEMRLQAKEDEISHLTTESSSLKSYKNSASANIEALKKELSQAKTKLASIDASDGSLIRSYSKLNTASVKCKVKHILYFKEVSYVPYVNSLIMAMMNSLTVHSMSTKLVIYDNKTDLHQVYKPLNVVRGAEYVANKHNLLNKVSSFVVAEPAPVILNELITIPDYAVMIIYDRMKSAEDLIVGNNVTKFFVLNSKQEYSQLAGNLQIADESRIITRWDSEFSSGAIGIPYVEGYKNGSDSSKLSKYAKMETKSGENLLNLLLSKAMIRF